MKNSVRSYKKEPPLMKKRVGSIQKKSDYLPTRFCYLKRDLAKGTR